MLMKANPAKSMFDDLEVELELALQVYVEVKVYPDWQVVQVVVELHVEQPEIAAEH